MLGQVVSWWWTLGILLFFAFCACISEKTDQKFFSMGTRARPCATCSTSHLPLTGKQCMIQAPLPPDEKVADVESVESKVEMLKAQIANKQQVVDRTEEIQQLEQQLANLSVRQSKLQSGRHTLEKSVLELTHTPGLHDKKSKKSSMGYVHDNPFQKEEPKEPETQPPARAVRFSRLGEWSSSCDSDTGSNSSGETRASKKRRRKSGTRKRRKLLRLHQYSSSLKKPKNFEDCISASMGLAIKLSGLETDITGYLEHIWFISEQSSLGRFRPECILSYDEAGRDKAAVKGLSVFGYGDAENFYRHLGSGALVMKKDQKTKSIPGNRYTEGKPKASDIKELRLCGLYIIMGLVTTVHCVIRNISVLHVTKIIQVLSVPAWWQTIIQ